MRAVDQQADGPASLGRIAGNDGIQHSAVQGQRLGRTALFTGGQLKTGAQQRAERLAHLHQHAVVRSPQQALVEPQIEGHVVTALGHGAFHAGVGLFNAGNVFWRGTQRGQLDGSGLHHAAQILQVPDEFWGQTCNGLPGNDVGIEPVPLVRRQHAGAHFGAGHDQAFGHQGLDGLSHHGAAHAQFLAQHRLGRNASAQSVTAGNNGLPQKINGVAVDVLDHDVAC